MVFLYVNGLTPSPAGRRLGWESKSNDITKSLHRKHQLYITRIISLFLIIYSLSLKALKIFPQHIELEVFFKMCGQYLHFHWVYHYTLANFAGTHLCHGVPAKKSRRLVSVNSLGAIPCWINSPLALGYCPFGKEIWPRCIIFDTSNGTCTEPLGVVNCTIDNILSHLSHRTFSIHELKSPQIIHCGLFIKGGVSKFPLHTIARLKIKTYALHRN